MSRCRNRSSRPFQLAMPATLCAAVASAGTARAGDGWTGHVPPGQSAAVNIRMEVTAPIVGSDADQSLRPCAFDGMAVAHLAPASGQFTTAHFVDLDFTFSGGTFDYQLYCAFVDGCEQYSVVLDNATISLQAPITVALGPNGEFGITGNFDASFQATLSGTLSGAFDVAGTITATVTGRVVEHDASVGIHDLDMSEFWLPVPPSAVPPGVDADIYIHPIFSSKNFLIGPWTWGLDGDFDGNGAVDGADLSTLLSVWATADAMADLNHDGVVDGADLAMLLTNWG